MKCFLKAKFSRIYSTHGSWYTFQIVVDDDELEMGWNDLRIMRWELTRTGGLADIAFMVMDVVERELGTYLYRGVRMRSWSTPAHGDPAYQHVLVLVTLIMENALES